ncbi:tetratricopeptide repeat protein [Streptomyces sp. NPDC046324]|uniref:tetratricopeptide repeat protein n=1 Tax=Streptomyces sp. NPDC046324 TaxID=3154915 RepID=UPI0033CB5C14
MDTTTDTTALRRRVGEHLARARWHRAGGRYTEAERALRAALRLARGTAGPASADVADAASALGILLEALGRPAEAEEALRHAVHLYESVYGPDDTRLAPPLNALGAVLRLHGDLTGAERLCRRVVDIVGRTTA